MDNEEDLRHQYYCYCKAAEELKGEAPQQMRRRVVATLVQMKLLDEKEKKQRPKELGYIKLIYEDNFYNMILQS